MLFVALLLRLLHAYAIDQAPTSDFLLGDAESYHQWALTLAAGDWLGDEVFYQAPLYPYSLGVLYALFGPDPWLVRLAQVVLGSLACVFIALAGRRWFTPRVGIWAGFMLAAYAPAIFFVGLVQKTTLALVLFCVLLWLLSITLDDVGRELPVWAAIGVCLAVTMLTRENAIILVAPIALWLALGPSGGGRLARLRSGTAFALGLMLVLLPVALRNHHVGGGFNLTTSQLGSNLYIGNNEDADGTYRPIRSGRDDPRFEQADAHAFAENIAGRSLTPSEVSSVLVERVVDYVVDHPTAWAALMWRKFLLVANAAEIADTEDLVTHADRSAVLTVTGRVWHFGVLLPLAALGVVLTWNERHRVWPLYALTLVYAVGVVTFYVFARYRFPLVPLAILFAAAGVTSLTARVGSRRLAIGAAVGVTTALVANMQLIDIAVMRSVTEFNYGFAFHELDEHGLARQHFERAVRFQPNLAEAHYRLGILDMETSDIDAAVERFERALAVAPELDGIRNALGNALLGRGDLDAAESHFLAAVAREPDDAQTWSNLASISFQRRDADEAAKRYARSLELDPSQAQTHNNLGIVLAIQGDIQRAIESFRQALELEPDYEEARKNLEHALSST